MNPTRALFFSININTMNFIRTFVKRVMGRENPLPIGRWKRETCMKTLNYKVDMSNEDHCGPCGQYALKKTNQTNDNRALKTIKPQ